MTQILQFFGKAHAIYESIDSYRFNQLKRDLMTIKTSKVERNSTSAPQLPTSTALCVVVHGAVQSAVVPGFHGSVQSMKDVGMNEAAGGIRHGPKSHAQQGYIRPVPNFGAQACNWGTS